MKPPGKLTWRELLAALASERSAREEGPRGTTQVSTSPIDREALARIRAYGRIHRGDFAEEDIDDAVQSVMLRLMDAEFVRRLSQRAIGPGYFVNWLRNLLVSAGRKSRLPEALAEELRSRALAEEEDEEALARIQHLREAIDRLPIEDRGLLRELYEDFESVRAMAHAKGLPYTTLSKRVSRARNRLRQIMEETGY